MPTLNNKPENKVLLSYAGGDESERIANYLERSFSERSIRAVRDEKDYGYQASFSQFVQHIGQNHAIILIISDKYLRSENCIFEWVEIEKNVALREHIFPVVLSDADVFTPTGRLSYIKYWDGQIQDLKIAINKVETTINLAEVTAKLEKYVEIRSSIHHLMDFLENANVLTPEVSSSSEFSALLNAIEGTMVKSTQLSGEVIKKTLHLKMDGKAFQKGIYIHTVVDSLNELQFILDRNYFRFLDRNYFR